MGLVFVRHGEITANAEGRLQEHADYELSLIGRAQVEKLHERFEKEVFRPTHVYSSPLKRSAQTAAIVSRPWPLGVMFWDDLKE